MTSTMRRNTALIPPTFKLLVEHPEYRKFVRTMPTIPANMRQGRPWAVWAITHNARWRGGLFESYVDAWGATLKAMRNTEKYRDVALVSRRQLFEPPRAVIPLIEYPFEWCPRCRRPTMYRPLQRHHAVEILTLQDPYRCYFCGIRRSFAGETIY